MTEAKQKFIELLAESGAIQFGEFIAKSGRKTPFFINTGKLMYGDQLDLVGKMYAQAYVENVGEESRILYGPAYKGITLVAVTAAALSAQHGVRVPVCFNRKEKKDHGEGGVFVGKIPEEGDRIVIVEDVITAGTAIRESMGLLKALGKGSVEAVIIAVDRMEKGTGNESSLAELGREFGVKIYPILTIREIVSYLYEHDVGGKRYIDDSMYRRILAYQEEYGAG